MNCKKELISAIILSDMRKLWERPGFIKERWAWRETVKWALIHKMEARQRNRWEFKFCDTCRGWQWSPREATTYLDQKKNIYYKIGGNYDTEQQINGGGKRRQNPYGAIVGHKLGSLFNCTRTCWLVTWQIHWWWTESSSYITSSLSNFFLHKIKMCFEFCLIVLLVFVKWVETDLGGNPSTSFMLIFALIGGGMGASSMLAGFFHLRKWTSHSLASAASSAIISWAITALAFGYSYYYCFQFQSLFICKLNLYIN